METNKSAFDHIDYIYSDNIIQILERYNLCEDINKVNLTIGAYRDENLNPVVFRCVQEAEKRIFSSNLSREYLSPIGDEEFSKLTQSTIFKEDHEIYKLNKILSIHSLAGSGTIRLGAELISKFISKNVYIPDLTWPNHSTIFSSSGMNLFTYRFYNDEYKGLDINILLEDLSKAEEGSVVILQVCGNNPTGVDPNFEEWNKIADVMIKNKLLPFFDMAYQGFVTGDMYADSYPIRLFYDKGLEMMISQSFSKIMGLYGERAAPLHFIINDPNLIPKIKSQVENIAMGLYLCPVSHGARIIKTVLLDGELRKDWEIQLKECVNRLRYVREKLHSTLINIKAPGNWDHIIKQNGMFSYTGLNAEQCEELIKNHKIFLATSGRISLSGLNQNNIEKVALAVKEILSKN